MMENFSDSKAVHDVNQFDSEAKKADVCIFTYLNAIGNIRKDAHTVCVKYSSGMLEVYNRYSDSTGVPPEATFKTWVETGKIVPIVLVCINK